MNTGVMKTYETIRQPEHENERQKFRKSRVGVSR
jgi:hypothetical protein